MAKVLLVEDDANLREIYADRIQSEGYETSTADDGENALAVAIKERPDLIILDVMMPKISGFDVLDILRSTPETKNTKIMMMTALGQDTDRERGEKLGVNRYLVKSQVTLEDMITNIKQLIDGAASIPPPAEAAPAVSSSDTPASPEPASETPSTSDNTDVTSPSDQAIQDNPIQATVSTDSPSDDLAPTQDVPDPVTPLQTDAQPVDNSTVAPVATPAAQDDPAPVAPSTNSSSSEDSDQVAVDSSTDDSSDEQPPVPAAISKDAETQPEPVEEKPAEATPVPVLEPEAESSEQEVSQLPASQESDDSDEIAQPQTPGTIIKPQ